MAILPENNPPSRAEKAKLEMTIQLIFPDRECFFNQKNAKLIKDIVSKSAQGNDKLGQSINFNRDISSWNLFKDKVFEFWKFIEKK